MAGYDNIKNRGFDSRTTDERREIAKKAGKASGKVRRKKADFKKALNALLTLQIDDKELIESLDKLGVEKTLENAILFGQAKSAAKGNTSAAYFIAQYSGQTDKLADNKQDNGQAGIKNFLKAVKPSEEELEELFGKEDGDR